MRSNLSLTGRDQIGAQAELRSPMRHLSVKRGVYLLVVLTWSLLKVVV